MKMCTVCGIVKDNNDFYWHSNNNRYHSECKDCSKKRSKRYREQNPDKIKQMREKYKERRKDIRYETDRKSYLKYKYNINEEIYNDMYQQRDGCCEICGKQIEYRKLCVDHNHINNKLRGMLCKSCNMALGLFTDNIDILKNAINYLERYDINE